MNRILTLASVSALLIYGCGHETPAPVKMDGPIALDQSNFDTTISPANDFYRFINGNWLKNNPVPETESAWGSFNVLNDQNTKNLKAILEEVAADNSAPAGSPKQKVGDFYRTGMDTNKIEKDGITPIQGELDMIASIKDKNDLSVKIGKLHMMNTNAFFGFDVGQDQEVSTKNICYMSQSGMGLPDKPYYLSSDPEKKELRDKYVDHVTKMFILLGDKEDVAAKNAATVLKIETELATASMSRTEQRNPKALYNKKTYAEFKQIAPSFNWDEYFKVLGLNDLTEIVVAQPKFFVQVEGMMKSVSIDEWKAYLRWQFISVCATKLDSKFVAQSFKFYGTEMNGTKQMKPRWKRCLEVIDGSIGETIGQLYVEKYFSAESKKRVKEMVENMIEAYKERIQSREWMSAETKQQAIGKLNTIMLKIGYPDNWRDYSALDIKADSYVQNFLRATEFESKRHVARLGKPVDRAEWGMTPQTVNAYYNPSLNEIVFPAGIIQFPFFNFAADDAVNYGMMGAVIGHELTHGFDDQGSQYNAEGNLKNWWTQQDSSNFQERIGKIREQFDAYVAIDSLHVNGQLTLGENIADLGGLTIAYYGFKRSLKDKPSPEKIDGYTPEQRLFMSWAQGWRSNYQPEFLKYMVNTNPHSPSQFRVNGPLSNMTEFYQAFNVKEGDGMHRKDAVRANVW